MVCVGSAESIGAAFELLGGEWLGSVDVVFAVGVVGIAVALAVADLVVAKTEVVVLGVEGGK